MKKTLLGTLFALCALSTQTLAAQNNSCFDYNQSCDDPFDGFYIGGNIAVFTDQSHRNDLDGFLTDNSGWTVNDSSFAGGLQAGWDWQCGNRVIGIVGDWSFVTTGHTLNDNPNTPGELNHIKKDLDWYSTIRARAGLAVCDTFVYVTAGAAIANFETKWQDNDVRFKHDDTRWGWTGGVGAEFLYSSCFSVGVDLLYLHFADEVKTFRDAQSNAFSFGESDSCWTARLAVNYRM